MLLTKESTRWLAQHDRHEEALQSLIWVRGGDRMEVRMEFHEIVAGIEEEERQTAGVTWREYWLPANRYRIFLAVTLQIGEISLFPDVAVICFNMLTWRI
jgi:hypothetical protein